ncbi:hypothetical protein [Candidatus Tisiphia endosymbiont of Nemotelus uliginosus]|uniref:hypothetical protein n=1 Tax=Candidatus Tisiphia endosymbiont of Nemotelus uliginosus TaxID=3077926 RepID=UPI0035C9022C
MDWFLKNARLIRAIDLLIDNGANTCTISSNDKQWSCHLVEATQARAPPYYPTFVIGGTTLLSLRANIRKCGKPGKFQIIKLLHFGRFCLDCHAC